jgi:hypothetical protein
MITDCPPSSRNCWNLLFFAISFRPLKIDQNIFLFTEPRTDPAVKPPPPVPISLAPHSFRATLVKIDRHNHAAAPDQHPD